MEKLKVGIVSLGCDKNRIDSEIILGNIQNEYEIVTDPKEAEVLLVNTCGFIETAKQESIDAILEMAEYKKVHNCKILVVTGCLTQRYGKDLNELIPEIDIILGVNDYDKLNKSIKEFMEEKHKIYYCTYSDEGVNNGKRVLTTGKFSAYLRVAEGCNNFCTYCIIPKIRGKYRSRKIEDILEEARYLAENGVKELILVAQDTTRYGTDLYGEKKLHELLKKLSDIDGIKWIRILYCYPEEITDELINEISVNEKVCKYIDMPIQHISNNILKLMKRRGTKELILNNINKMREKISGLVLRTSIIVGFPGETEEDFNELKSFIKDIRFDKLGVFKYSQEEDTVAATMENQIDEQVKEKREEVIMLMQMQISEEINHEKLGKIYDVIIEDKNEEGFSGRNYEMAPEIDGSIFIKDNCNMKIGDMVKVKITESQEYDLIGVVCNESCK